MGPGRVSLIPQDCIAMYDGAAMWGRLLLVAMLAVPMFAAPIGQSARGYGFAKRGRPS